MTSHAQCAMKLSHIRRMETPTRHLTASRIHRNRGRAPTSKTWTSLLPMALARIRFHSILRFNSAAYYSNVMRTREAEAQHNCIRTKRGPGNNREIVRPADAIVPPPPPLSPHHSPGRRPPSSVQNSGGG